MSRTETAPRIVVSVGTDVHPFDRLVAWIDAWASTSGMADEVFVQYGTSRPPAVVEGSAYLDHTELVRLVTGADVVVTHGGPATIMEVRERHGTPIVVPRDPRHGEHVDRHQMDFAAVMAREGHVDLATDESRFCELVEQHLASPPVPPNDREIVVPQGVVRFGQLVDLLLSGNARRNREVPTR